MSGNEPTRTTDSLHELLQRADPAADTPGLPADDAREIRRRMLDAAENAHRPFLDGLAGLVPRSAWVAVAALLLLAAVWIWRAGDGSDSPSPGTPVEITRETPLEALPPQVPPARPEAPEPEKDSIPPETRVARVDPAEEPRVDGVPEKRAARQVQMQAPGGTRIVWVLDPDLTL